MIKMNEVSESLIGIYCGSPLSGYPAINNKIENNTITEVIIDGIQVYEYASNNLINGNTISDMNCYFNFGGWAIHLEGSDCNNNVLKNNTCVNNDIPASFPDCGIILLGGTSNNTIGPNNTCNYNDFGILLDAGTMYNHVFNNTALDNSAFDIFNLGTDNTFKNNTAENTLGL